MRKILFIGISLMLFSCNDRQNITAKFESHFKTDNQYFSFIGDLEKTFVGAKGTKIMIPQGAIENTFEYDTINVILKEVYGVSDMLLNGLSTSSDGNILESNGMINITIMKNSQKVKVLNKPLRISFNGDSSENDFNIFYGNESEAGLNWREASSTDNYQITFYQVLGGRVASPPWRGEYVISAEIWDSIKWDKNYSEIDSFIVFERSQDTIPYRQFEEESESFIATKVDKLFKSVELDWINCDRFLKFNNLTEIRIKNSINQDFYVFCIFKKFNSILSNEGKAQIANVPIGESVSFVAIEFNGNKIRFDFIDNIEVSNGMEVAFELEDVTMDFVKEQIYQLEI